MFRLAPLLTCVLALLFPSFAAAQAKQKNVLLIVADDLGLTLGCYSDPIAKTPNLDLLARSGVRFSKAYTTVASCSPSRASLYSGMFTHQNGTYGLQHSSHKQESHPWVQSLPNLLRLAGYYTGIIGKIHVGPDSVFNWEARVAKTNPRDPAKMAEQARQFINQSGKRPFFLVMGYTDPHRAKAGFGNEPFAQDPKEIKVDPKTVPVPPHLPDNPQVRQDLAEYYQSVSRLDRGVGMLLEVLKESGHLDDTLVIFVSDNGIPFPGAKTTLYEAGTHLPLLVSGPGVPKGRTNNAMVSYIDLAPTILDWASAKGPTSYKLPGRSILPILDQDNPKGWDQVFGSHQFHEITMYYPMRSITTPKHKYLLNLANKLPAPLASDLWGSPSWQCVRKDPNAMVGGRKMADFLYRPKEELYDLTKDPHEMRNLAGDPAYAEVLSDLRRRVRAWQQETRDPWAILYREEDPAFNQ